MLQPPLLKVAIAIAIAIPIAMRPGQSALAQDLSFTLTNASSSALTEFYLVPEDAETWGENIADDGLEPGETATVSIEDGETTCVYDIYATFEDGSTLEDGGVDICETADYTLVD